MSTRAILVSLSALIVLTMGASAWALWSLSSLGDDFAAVSVQPPEFEPQDNAEPISTAPPPTPAEPPAGGSSVEADWLRDTALASGIPERAFQAYVAAAEHSAETYPKCNLAWNTLAGIGWIESQHGTYGGSTIDPDGRARPEIYGVVLNGEGFALIKDTDGGALDGDSSYDRAVGPMQFIPATWKTYGVALKEGATPDPHNIDDAALSAAHYLCDRGGDLSTGPGWRAALHAYNQSDVYAQSVHAAAEYYEGA